MNINNNERNIWSFLKTVITHIKKLITNEI